MAGEEVSQLVILGNGFDLHFNQKTKFENYIASLLKPTKNKELNNKIREVENQCSMLLNNKPDICVKLDNIMQFVDSKNNDENAILLLYLAKRYETLKGKIAPNQYRIFRRAADNARKTMWSVSNNKSSLKSSEPSDMEISFNKERKRRINILDEQKKQDFREGKKKC